MSQPSWTILSIHINHSLISYPSLKKWDLSVHFKSLLPSCHPCLGCIQGKHRNLWQKTPSVPSYPWNFPNPWFDPEVKEPTSSSSMEPLSLTKNNQVSPTQSQCPQPVRQTIPQSRHMDFLDFLNRIKRSHSLRLCRTLAGRGWALDQCSNE